MLTRSPKLFFNDVQPPINYPTELKRHENAINRIVERLQKIQGSETLIKLITSQQNAYIEAIANTRNARLKYQFLQSYEKFVYELGVAINAPSNNMERLRAYQNADVYAYAGGWNARNTKTMYDSVAEHSMKMSLILLALSLCLMPLSFPLAISLFAMSLSVLLPSATYYIGESQANQRKVQANEMTLFSAIPEVMRHESSAPRL